MEHTYEALVKLALFCVNQARSSVIKDAAREKYRRRVAWRL